MDADVIVIGHGLAGLTATTELVAAGRRVLLLDQSSEQNLGGQAWWSFGGLFLVDSPEQRRLRVRDSLELAWQDWSGSASWDRVTGENPEDLWAKRWGRAYVEFAAGEKRAWLHVLGVRFTPVVGWAERGDGRAHGHGNSVPRFHIPWGTGTGIVAPFIAAVRAGIDAGRVLYRPRHRVTELVRTGGTVTGVSGVVLAPDEAPRGAPAGHTETDAFEFSADAVVVASGGIGGNHDAVLRAWPARLGTPPARMVTGVPDYVDGRMLDTAERGGARLVNGDRMWHYTEGIENWAPVWPDHAIRILPGPSPLWFDAIGRRLPSPGLPGYDTLGTLRLLRTDPAIAGYDHSWFIVTRRMIEKEFALSGSEQNPDLTGRDLRLLLRSRLGGGTPGPVADFVRHGADFVHARTLPELVERMNALTETPLLDAAQIGRQITERDREIDNPFSKDRQVVGIHNARRYLGDRLMRAAKPHRVLDPAAGPLIAVRLHILTRKSLGGIQTDLDGRALDTRGEPVPGLYAAGEAAGFGGGGAHGYNALEGTFLGGCLFTGRTVGRTLAR